jgi:hypothetical protein
MRWQTRRRALLGLLAAAAGSFGWGGMGAPAGAIQQPKSIYTVIDLAECRRVKQHSDGDSWTCKGLPGVPVYLAEGDHRTFLSFGPNAEKRRAAEQTLAPFNSIFPDKKSRMAIEWRFTLRDNRAAPYATIVRYFTVSGSKRGEVLVVTRVGEQDTCHVAYIDALARKDALVLARQVADQRARRFDCRSEPDSSLADGVD